LAVQSGSKTPPEIVNQIISELITTKRLPMNAISVTKMKCSIAVLAQERATNPKAADSKA
jgi:hypothetical protein